MAKTGLVYLLPAFLVATYWSRLETSAGGEGRFLWMAALALAPALVRPLWARALAVLAVAALAARAALHVSVLEALPFRDDHFFGPLASRSWRGFGAYFDVAVPFRPDDHPAMHGVTLLAVFGFCLGISLAIAARRPLAAAAALIAGAGWPATILTGENDLARGALVLAAALLLFAALRLYPTHGVRQPVLAGAALVLGALVLSTSPSVARGGFIEGWRDWDVDARAGRSLGVEYVWDSSYAGIKFPSEPTTVLRIEAPEDASVYWRATTLDSFLRGRWLEELFGAAEPFRVGGLDDLSADPFLPAAARNRDNWLRADVEVQALRDIHLVGASVPVAYEVGDRDVRYSYGNIAVAMEGGLGRGETYTVFSYSPQPTARQLSRSRARYPDYLLFSPYLALDYVNMPQFGAPGRERLMEANFRDPRLGAYRSVYRTARNVVGRPRNPYAAVVALETWFRGGGGFVYDEQPPRTPGTPPLVSFVTSTKRGYCQHFAGAMALMLRQLGIPARVAAGFTAGRYDRDNGHWVVADRNAHTWVEAWFAGYGWLPFDPTPGRGRLSAAYTASSPQFDVSGARDILRQAGGAASELLRGETQGADRPRGAQESAARRLFSSPRDDPKRGLLALVLLLAVGGLAALTAAKLVRRGARFLTRDPRRVAAACRRDLVGFLVDQGVPVPASATLAELGRTVERELAVNAGRLVEALTLARFGPAAEAAGAAVQARRELRRVRRALRARLSVPRRARGLVSLRSLAA